MVLDLQPGRDNFLNQVQAYQQLLQEPNVGLALDPEWRLAPNELPLGQIGSVGIEEVNQTNRWLAQLTKDYKLPQKLFLVHQFSLAMLPSREQLDTAHSELAYVVQMDGQGSQEQKLASWQAITVNPEPVAYFGWKNFYANDTPLRTPQETMQLSPKPWYVSYQ